MIETNQGIVESWKNASYWKLPENVRSAIDIARKKAHHSDFYYRLEVLNDKLLVFQDMFYTNMPQHQKTFYERKKYELEEKLEEQRAKHLQGLSVLNKLKNDEKIKKVAKKGKKPQDDAPMYLPFDGERPPG